MKIDPKRMITAASEYETGMSVAWRTHGTVRASPETYNLAKKLTSICCSMARSPRCLSEMAARLPVSSICGRRLPSRDAYTLCRER